MSRSRILRFAATAAATVRGPRPGALAALAAAAFLTVAPHLGRPAAAQQPAAADEAGDATVVYLMRHAETAPPPYADDPPDPALSHAGRARAAALARLLAPAGVTHVLSTDYRRTRQTAAPLLEALELPLELYRSLEETAARIRRQPGRYVVSGHSNTTPRMVELLGGEPGEPIDDATEFDRLYIVVLQGDRHVSTVRLRYGPPPGPR